MTRTFWHQHPETIERLAAEYALGTMPAGARRRFESLMRDRQDISRAVWSWHDTLSGAIVSQTPLAVDPAQWDQLEARLFAPAAASGALASTPAGKPGQRASWWSRWLAPVPTGMLAFGLSMGLLIPPVLDAMRGDKQTTQLPESYVGVLATADGQPGLIVSSLRKGLIVDLKQVTPVAVPAGKALYLWSIDKAGVAHPIAPIPAKRFASVRLAASSETTFMDAVALAVSIEPENTAPLQPAGHFVYRGLCGKIWMPPGVRM